MGIPCFGIDGKRLADVPVSSPTVKQRICAIAKSRGQTVAPNVSDDLTSQQFRLELQNELETALPCKLDELLMPSENTIPSDFSKLRSITGYRPDRANLPPVSNRDVLERNNQVEDFESQEDEDIFKIIFDLMFSNPKRADLRLQRNSSFMFPTYESALEAKKNVVRDLTSKDNIETILRLWREGAFKRLWRDYAFLPVNTLVWRFQPQKWVDGAPKRRPIHTLSGALGSSEGIVDMDMSIPELNNPNICSPYQRTAHGANGIVNVLISIVFFCLRAYYFKRYERTFKLRSPSELEDAFDDYPYSIAIDCANFDNSLIMKIIERFSLWLENVIDPTFAQIIKRALGAPYLAYKYIRDKKAAVVVGDIFNIDANLEYGLCSGIACNPDVGKWYMVSVLFTGLVKCLNLKPSKQIFDTILQGRHSEIRIFDTGDDALLNFKNKEDYLKVLDAIRTGSFTRYLKIELEPGSQYLGNVIYKKNDQKFSAVSNVVTWVVNRFCPEVGIDIAGANLRPFTFKLGFLAAEQNARRNETAHPIAKEIMNEIYYKHYGIMFEAAVENLANRNMRIFNESIRRESRLLEGGYTHTEMEFIAEPERIHYRIAPEDISPDLLSNYMATIPFDDLSTFTDLIFGHELQEMEVGNEN